MTELRILGKKVLVNALSVSLVFSGPLQAAVTDIADYPITQPATASLNPNLLLILDDSGSMRRQFSPDYVSSYTKGTGGTEVTRNCFDALDSSNNITTTLEECLAGDPPAMSPDFNTQYYNPEVRYLPALNYDGTESTSMTAANTNNWRQVPTDAVSASNIDWARKDLHSGTNWEMGANPVIETMDLANLWPDRVWCTDKGDLAIGPNCKTNSAYLYPNAVYGFGTDLIGARKYKFGGPYYYRIEATEYCSTARLDNCVAATAPTVVGGLSYNVPAPVRFCTDSTLATCQAKRVPATHAYPKYAGTVVTGTSATPAVSAFGRITVTDPQPDSGGAAQGNVTSIIVTKPDGSSVNIISAAALTLAGGQSASNWATSIANRIGTTCGGGHVSVPDYRASANTNVVTITACDPGADTNTATITVNQNVTGRTPARITITFTNTVKSNNAASAGFLSSLIISGQQFVTPATIRCTTANCNSNNGGTRNNEMASRVRSLLVPPAGWTVTGATNQVILTAPATTGSELNGVVVAITAGNTTATGGNGSRLQGGITVGDVTHTTTNFTNGANTIPAGAQRQSVGTFVRTDILPGQTYNQHPGRSDCVAQPGVCTYEEEMTNFANWFSYYRTRMQMAKTAIGRAIALAALPDNWRLGFMTINFASTDYLAVAPFLTGAGAQRDLWYQKLYGADANGGTPLRSALSRAGRYFADRNPSNMGRTPINSACQPNFAVLTSDGYWNDTGTPAVKLDGTTAVDNQDGDSHSNTLADVAAYYYNNDLLPGPPAVAPATVGFKDQVPASGIDTAPHQHMTTFTVGMGISGRLLFHPNYLEPGNSIDYDTIAGVPGTPGTNAWPQPVADTDTTVDDMWHAAVNGKGRFFSAQNPVALAAGINEVLTSVAKRVGAGAAAATSNLQPVAGDNFAFTAQYTTVEWGGDLKARTISLVDGVISQRELWSAQGQLNQRTSLNRVIYTADPADADTAQSVTVAGETRSQNGNRLRSFCRSDAPLVGNPTCNDGGLLSAAEQDTYFDPLAMGSALSQTAAWPSGDPRRTAATKESLVNFLRGETANEMVLGGTGATDLYRNRANLLGDIVSAQPAYVKGSPFNYQPQTDPFYIDFRNSTNGTSGTRRGTVYVAANDGMLHAFETDPDNVPYYQSKGVSSRDDTTDDEFVGTLSTDPVTGEGAERWAYIPTLVFPTLKRLAEGNYATNHRFFVDGSPVVGDVCFGHTASAPCSAQSKWHTILVGGLNAGGRGYYALDVTDPNNPKGLWELRGGSDANCIVQDSDVNGTQTGDCNIGLSFGNPIITKRPEDGRWVVLVTSGHNNVSPGDGVGHLYVVDAETGKILKRMSTGVGDAATPSGLARINAWVDNALMDNTAKAVYGGDLAGNLWRFQLDVSATPSIPRYSVTRVATVQDPSGVPQPITVKPELMEIPAGASKYRAIFFGTGKFYGSTDKTDNQRQSVYGIKDPLSGASSPQVDMARLGGLIPNFKQQVLIAQGTEARVIQTPPATVDWSSDGGWYIDLPDGGSGEDAAERANIDPILQLGTLVVPTNVPSSETCVAGGFGWVNFLDPRSGGLVSTGLSGTVSSTKVAGSLIVGINVVKIGDKIKTVVTTADNQQLTTDTPITPTSLQGRRVSWRELIVE
jgi:type IV pilus assembly protein PilY1